LGCTEPAPYPCGWAGRGCCNGSAPQRYSETTRQTRVGACWFTLPLCASGPPSPRGPDRIGSAGHTAGLAHPKGPGGGPRSPLGGRGLGLGRGGALGADDGPAAGPAPVAATPRAAGPQLHVLPLGILCRPVTPVPAPGAAVTLPSQISSSSPAARRRTTARHLACQRRPHSSSDSLTRCDRHTESPTDPPRSRFALTA